MLFVGGAFVVNAFSVNTVTILARLFLQCSNDHTNAMGVQNSGNERRLDAMSKKTNKKNTVNQAEKANPATEAKAETVATVAKPPVVKAEKKVETKEDKLKAIRAKYPNQKITDNSLEFNEDKQKLSVEITCQHPGCNSKRKVFTSDLFQVRFCEKHIKQARKQARKEKREAAREALKASITK